MNSFQWLREYFRRKKGHDVTDPRSIVDSDYGYWSTFKDKELERLNNLLECVILDMRMVNRVSNEEEESMRKLVNAVNNVIIWCKRDHQDYLDKLALDKKFIEEKEEKLERAKGLY